MYFNRCQYNPKLYLGTGKNDQCKRQVSSKSPTYCTQHLNKISNNKVTMTYEEYTKRCTQLGRTHGLPDSKLKNDVPKSDYQLTTEDLLVFQNICSNRSEDSKNEIAKLINKLQPFKTLNSLSKLKKHELCGIIRDVIISNPDIAEYIEEFTETQEYEEE